MMESAGHPRGWPSRCDGGRLITSLLFAGRHNRHRMPRILLIDDDEHLAAPLASYFARFDCVLESAQRPSDGLAKLRAQAYDCAILDVMLPEMDASPCAARSARRATSRS